MPPSLLLRPRGLPKRGLVGYWKFDERKNLLKYSQQFDNAAWTKTGCTITPNTTTAPDGTQTADTIVLTVGAAHALSQTVAVSPSTVYTFSAWAQLGTADDLKYAIYDLTHSADIIAPTAYGASAAMVRHAATFTTPAGCTSISVRVVYDSAQDDGETAHLYGAQLEAGSYANTYFPTTDKQTVMDYSKPRKNLLLPNQANVGEDGTTAGFATNGTGTITLTSDTTEHWQGARSLKIVTGGENANHGAGNIPFVYGLTPGATYTASVYVKSTAGEGLIFQFIERTDAGSVVTETNQTFVSTGGWDRVTVSRTFSAAGRAASLKVLHPPKDPSTFWIDGLQIEEGSVATAWEAPPNHGVLGSSLGADTNDPTWTGQGLLYGADDYVKFGPITDSAGVVQPMGAMLTAFYAPAPVSAASAKSCSFALAPNAAIYLGAVAGAPANNIITIQYDAAGSYTSWCDAAGSIAAGWHTLGIVWDGTAYALVLDGVTLPATSAGTPALLPLSNANCCYDGTTYGNGLIHAARGVWDRGLAPSEVARATRAIKAELAGAVVLP